ncbi:MAG: PorP/SprF family type IX secretion system membrane protein [Chitinophagales bacterium]|nr:PorP/SprF family type IX secretion system membrane protein [Chitinophagales bacterium]
MLKQFYLFACLVLGTFALQAQDVHFSQYFASPLMLNPANTGNFNGDFRAQAIYRNQFFGEFGTSHATYASYSGSFDMALLRGKINLDQLGVGALFYVDKSGSGSLLTTNVAASVAYHKVLDQYNRHSLSFGVQAGIMHKRIDFTKLTFEEQYNESIDDFDPTQLTGEGATNSSNLAPIVNAGVLWRSRFGKKLNAYAGFTYANINRPKETFLNNSSNRLESRFLAHGGLNFRVGKYVTLSPGFMFQTQSAAREATAGLTFGYSISDNSSVYFGTYYRIKDAIIPMVAYEISSFRIGASFDATVSDLRSANSSKGAFELSLIYIHNNQPDREFSPVKFCPRF